MQSELRLLHYYWELFWRRPLVWLIPAVLVVFTGIAYILLQPRTYESEAKIVVRSDRISPSLVQSTVTSERLHFIEQRVLVRDNLVALATKFDLFPGVRDTLSRGALANLVRNQIRITSDAPQSQQQTADVSTFMISFEAGDPQLAAAVTKAIVDMIVDENRRTRLSQASDATNFLEGEVDTLTARLRELDTKWDDFIRVNQNALPSRQAAHLQEIQSRQEELAQVDTKIAELTSEIRILQAQLSLGVPLADATRRGQTEELATLKRQLATRLSVLSESHPEIKTLRSRIASLESEMAQAQASAGETASNMTLNAEELGPELGLVAERIKSAQQQLAALADRRTQLSDAMAALQAVIASMPEVEAEMVNLDRQRAATQRNLDDMATKLNTARISERLEFEQQADQIAVLESPEVPKYASSTGRKKIFLVILLLAGGAGAAAVLAMDMMDKTIRGTFDISGALDGRTLVVIPSWSADRPRGALNTIRNLFAVLALAMLVGQAANPASTSPRELKRAASLTQAV